MTLLSKIQKNIVHILLVIILCVIFVGAEGGESGGCAMGGGGGGGGSKSGGGGKAGPTEKHAEGPRSISMGAGIGSFLERALNGKVFAPIASITGVPIWARPGQIYQAKLVNDKVLTVLTGFEKESIGFEPYVLTPNKGFPLPLQFKLIADIANGATSSYPCCYTNIGGGILFAASSWPSSNGMLYDIYFMDENLKVKQIATFNYPEYISKDKKFKAPQLDGESNPVKDDNGQIIYHLNDYFFAREPSLKVAENYVYIIGHHTSSGGKYSIYSLSGVFRLKINSNGLPEGSLESLNAKPKYPYGLTVRVENNIETIYWLEQGALKRVNPSSDTVEKVLDIFGSEMWLGPDQKFYIKGTFNSVQGLFVSDGTANGTVEIKDSGGYPTSVGSTAQYLYWTAGTWDKGYKFYVLKYGSTSPQVIASTPKETYFTSISGSPRSNRIIFGLQKGADYEGENCQLWYWEGSGDAKQLLANTGQVYGPVWWPEPGPFNSEILYLDIKRKGLKVSDLHRFEFLPSSDSKVAVMTPQKQKLQNVIDILSPTLAYAAEPETVQVGNDPNPTKPYEVLLDDSGNPSIEKIPVKFDFGKVKVGRRKEKHLYSKITYIGKKRPAVNEISRPGAKEKQYALHVEFRPDSPKPGWHHKVLRNLCSLTERLSTYTLTCNVEVSIIFRPVQGSKDGIEHGPADLMMTVFFDDWKSASAVFVNYGKGIKDELANNSVADVKSSSMAIPNTSVVVENLEVPNRTKCSGNPPQVGSVSMNIPGGGGSVTTSAWVHSRASDTAKGVEHAITVGPLATHLWELQLLQLEQMDSQLKQGLTADDSKNAAAAMLADPHAAPAGGGL